MKSKVSAMLRKGHEREDLGNVGETGGWGHFIRGLQRLRGFDLDSI